MSEEQDRYQSVDDFIPNWSPRKSGNKESGYTDLKPTDESWIVGYYLSSREQKSQKNDDVYVIHKMKVLGCGNHDHLGEPLDEGGKIYEFFGTSVVNNSLRDKVTPGQCVKIQWNGMQQPKTDKGREYQGWFVGIDTQTEPITVQNGTIIADGGAPEEVSAAPKKETAVPVDNAADMTPEGDDGLPF